MIRKKKSIRINKKNDRKESNVELPKMKGRRMIEKESNRREPDKRREKRKLTNPIYPVDQTPRVRLDFTWDESIELMDDWHWSMATEDWKSYSLSPYTPPSPLKNGKDALHDSIFQLINPTIIQSPKSSATTVVKSQLKTCLCQRTTKRGTGDSQSKMR